MTGHAIRRSEENAFMVPSRRSFLATGGTLIAASLLPGLAASPVLAATAAHSFKLGKADVTIITDGQFSLPKSFALAGRAEAEAAALFAKHSAAFELIAETNVTVVRLDGKVILIDTGAGPDFMPSLGKFSDNLEAAGIKAASITHVIFTHAHADHLWGVIDPLGDGTQFADARHVMSIAERDFWLKPGVEDRVPEAQKSMAVGIVRRIKGLAERIETVKPDAEIVPGVALIDTAGHTPGHVSVVVRSGSDELIVGGDALAQHIVSFAAPDWRWGPDLEPDRAIATRRKLLDRLATSKARLLGYHLPWPGVGRVEARDSAYRFIAG